MIGRVAQGSGGRGRIQLRCRPWLVASLVTLLGACGGGGDCLQAILPSVTATVLDDVTSENLADVATGTLRQGNRTEPFVSDGTFLVAGSNWSGSFEMEIAAPGYSPHVSMIVVPSYSCTVVTQHPVVRLMPEAG